MDDVSGYLHMSYESLRDLPWGIIIPITVFSYLGLVQALRFRALRQIKSKYAEYESDPYRLSYKQAQEIMQLPLLYDMPFLFSFGTQWALIKSYGIASGTPLLVKTRQLADPTKVGKRAEDTGVFLIEFLCGDIDNERGRLAMAKLNWLHHRYNIVPTDYIHTLSLFVLEPQRWIERFEWRAMTHLEKVAHFVYWRELGHRMGISGIPETLEGLAEWRVNYEKTNMYYIEENRIVTEATLDLFLKEQPKFMRGFMRDLFVSFIHEKHVREALGFPDPKPWATFLTVGFLRLRGFVIRHFFLPRLAAADPLSRPGPDGRLHRSPEAFKFEPWYIADTWWNRFRVWWKTGGKELPGQKYRSQGFVPDELGPVGFEKIAKESVHDQAKAMEEYVRKGGSKGAGCPFRYGW